MNALVIIDVQNDFMPGGALGVPEGDGIIPVINSIQDCFDLVIATQDWHPPDHVSFASNHHGKAVFEKADPDGVNQTLWPDHCVQGTEGAGFHPELETHRLAAIFRKGMNPGVDSYSAFYDNNHLVSTGLAGYLREKGVTRVYFCGLASDICVYHTIKDALAEGFSAVFIEDASRPLDADAFEDQKRELDTLGVRIISSSDF